MHISRYGIPDKILSDSGPQFANQYFKRFTAQYGIEHKTSSPGYSQSNGYAERAVQAAKNVLYTAKNSNEDTYLAQVAHRNTPREVILESPAQRLMGRRRKTQLPMSTTLIKPRVINPSTVTKRLNYYRQQDKKFYDLTAKPLSQLEKGDSVIRFPDKSGKFMQKVTIISESNEPLLQFGKQWPAL